MTFFRESWCPFYSVTPRKPSKPHGAYTASFDDLKGDDEWTIQPEIYVTPSMFEIVSGTLHIRQDS
ncbi:MAG: hypothetical protein IJF33_07180, partial [Clostridia bacterium]|nr:hypothetical protein [Clostridia bacterium]